MKKLIIAVTATAVLFTGSAGVSFAQTNAGDSVLLAQLFDMVKDLATAISSIIERQIGVLTSDTGRTPTPTPTPVPSPQPVPKPSPEPGVFSFNVTSPATGNMWTIGKTYEVKWESANPNMGTADAPNFVSLYLVSANSTSARPTVLWTVAAFARNTGSYKWMISKNVYPGEYQLAIEPYARPDRRSYGGTFAIVSDVSVPSVEITLGSGKGRSLTKEESDSWVLICTYGQWGCYHGYNGYQPPGCYRLCSAGGGNAPVGGEQGDKISGGFMCWGPGDCSTPCSSGGQGAICRPPCERRACVGGGSGGGSAPVGGVQTELKVKITNPSETTDAAWVKGVQQTIRWESTDPSMSLKETDFISIYAVGEKDGARAATISSKAYNDGDFRWTVSTRLAEGMYKIVLQSVANTSLKAMSSQFYVTGALSTPVAGETLFTKSGAERKIGEGGIEPDKKLQVLCCRVPGGGSCYTESGGTCSSCFAWCTRPL